MTTLAFPDYLEHLRAESRRFRDVLASCDPAARVPGCPDWDAADLLWHLAGVQWFWSTTIRTRPAPPSEDDEGPQRPETYDGLLAAFDTYSADLVEALEQADPAEPSWTWSDDKTVGFSFRRQAHEALIHRLDAEQAAGQETALDSRLAADGVAEVLGVMYGGVPSWGEFASSGKRVRLDCTDTGDSPWVEIGQFTGTDPDEGKAYDEIALEPVADPGEEPDLVIAGPAGPLDAWLWKRGTDEQVQVAGDDDVLRRFREAVSHPID